jgi:hypothetical protein
VNASLALRSDIPVGYSAGYFVCGLPSGATATFSPNPVQSEQDDTSTTYGSARTTVTLSVPYTVAANTYGLTFYASYQNAEGKVVQGLPGGAVAPRFAVLTVQPGHASIQAADAVPAANGQGCSPIPPGYQPIPQPTPGAGNYSVTSWVSNAHPARGETVTAYARLTLNGQPVFGAATNFLWYSYGVTRAPCHVVTDGTGTASCSTVNSTPLAGVPVTIEVTMLHNGFTFDTWTSYTM